MSALTCMLCITVTRYPRTQRCSRGIQMNWSASRVRVMSWSLGHSGAVIVCSHNNRLKLYCHSYIDMM